MNEREEEETLISSTAASPPSYSYLSDYQGVSMREPDVALLGNVHSNPMDQMEDQPYIDNEHHQISPPPKKRSLKERLIAVQQMDKV